MSADELFKALVIIALPAAVLYALIYGTQTRWWRDWIGWALLTKAVGMSIVLTYTALFLVFGPDYPYRDTIRNVGMAIVATGLWLALIAMVRVLLQRRRK